MSMEEDLYAALKPLGHPVVWGDFTHDVGLPRLTLQRISTVTNYSLKARADIESARVQVNVCAANYDAVMQLARAVSTTLTDLRDSGAIIRCRETSRRDFKVETGGEIIRLQMLEFGVRYRA